MPPDERSAENNKDTTEQPLRSEREKSTLPETEDSGTNPPPVNIPAKTEINAEPCSGLGEPTSYWCSFPEPKHKILLHFFYASMRQVHSEFLGTLPRFLRPSRRMPLPRSHWRVTRRRVRAINPLRVASADLPFAYDVWIDRIAATAMRSQRFRRQRMNGLR